MLNIPVTLGLVVYHILLYSLFTTIYISLDWHHHFRVPSDMEYDPSQSKLVRTKKPISTVSKMYFSAVTHLTLGYGDITPKTDMARLIVMMHASLSWLSFIMIFR